MAASGQQLPKVVENVLMLVTLASLSTKPLLMWAVLAFHAFWALTGLRNPSLVCREGGGALFASLLCPVLAAACQEQLPPWLSIAWAELLALGSIQVLLDFSCGSFVAWPLTLAALSTLGWALGLEARLCLLFLLVQELCCRCIFSKRHGHCFSLAEGLFWSQASAFLCCALCEGSGSGFRDWPPLGLFSMVLAAFGLVFWASLGACHEILCRWLPVGPEWAALAAAFLTIALFAAWGLTGAGCPNTFGVHVPLVWFVHYITEWHHLRLLLIQWPGLLAIGIAGANLLAVRLLSSTSKDGKQITRERIYVRKAFHALALALFVPPLLTGLAPFLSLSLLIASLLFIGLEACRVCRTPAVAGMLDVFVGRFLDKREDIARGDLVLTHLYLLLGCALPVWLGSLLPRNAGPSTSEELNAALKCWSGLLLIGVGDAFAASFGITFGQHRWPGSHRTLEGSAAFVAGVIVGAAILIALSFGMQGLTASKAQLLPFFSATCLSMLLEVYTESIDNLVLPLHFWPTLMAFQMP
eukprot:TRINITY_DN50769_c0_g1_i1.p1 TRINITY_DN50769_c0_g1~~TRINITY_DN50769_c0_g1_i1.p1  ORF type:complete len:537 (+),score=101.63 TRINITY_DN50769_c0_g1_i1:32-1612(+)